MDTPQTKTLDASDVGRERPKCGKSEVRPLPRRLHQSFINELDRIIHAHNGRAYDRRGKARRNCSGITMKNRYAEIRCAYLDLAELGYRLQYPKSLSTRHLNRLAEYWREKGLSPQTLNRRFSMLRVFCGWIGKREIVRDLRDYYPDDPSIYKRSGVAKKNLAWCANDVDPLVEIERAKAIDDRLALYLALQHYFGLRVKESIQMRPLHSTTDEHNVLEVFEGTKGGRPRLVKIETTEQREIVEWAKRVASESRDGTIRWPNRNWKSAQDHFYYLMKKMGITKKGKGVTAHGLRHGDLQREYTKSSGMKTPIEGMDPKLVDVAAHRLACKRVSWKAGHARDDVGASYYASHGHKLRQSVTWVGRGIPV